MKKLTTRKILNSKKAQTGTVLSMLTAYDYQTAQLLNETQLDMILVGDSVGNVVLGYDTTIEVSLTDMMTFGQAVSRGATDKFIIVDMPFGTYATVDSAMKNAIKLFQHTKACALKLEGSAPVFLEVISRCTQIGIPVMGHIGLTPQSVHQQGGYYVHGKDENSQAALFESALKLQEAGCFAIVLECIDADLAMRITEALDIPTIGIGSGQACDGQVLVINDLLKLGPDKAPSFCSPVANLYDIKKELVTSYLNTLSLNKNKDKSDNAGPRIH